MSNLKEYIEKQKGMFTYRLDTNKVESSLFINIVELVLSENEFDAEEQERINSSVKGVLTFEENGRISGSKRMFFDALAIQNESLCRELEPTMIDKAKEKGIFGVMEAAEKVKMRTKIQELLDSGLSSYRISKDTGVPSATISGLRNKKTDLGNISLNNAEKLFDYAEKKTLD